MLQQGQDRDGGGGREGDGGKKGAAQSSQSWSKVIKLQIWKSVKNIQIVCKALTYMAHIFLNSPTPLRAA